jgi:hypothetical protein
MQRTLRDYLLNYTKARLFGKIIISFSLSLALLDKWPCIFIRQASPCSPSLPSFLCHPSLRPLFFFSVLYYPKMATLETIRSSILSIELIEALRTVLSQATEPFLDLPGTTDCPGICISSGFAAFRRYVETKYQEKLDSQPKVPADYRLSGARRKLPSSPLASCTIRSEPSRRDIGTQTEPSCKTPAPQSQPRPRNPPSTAQTESAPEARDYKPRSRRLLPLRRICSSSSEHDSSDSRRIRRRPQQPRSHPSPIQGPSWLFSALYLCFLY